MGAGWCYLYRADGPSAPDEGHRFDPSRPLFDPYAKAFTGALPARRRATELPALPPRCVVVRDDFDLAGDATRGTLLSYTKLPTRRHVNFSNRL